MITFYNWGGVTSMIHDVKQLTLQAIKKKEMLAYLRGEGEYQIQPLSEFDSCSTPSDWSRALLEGIYPVYREYPKLHMDQLFVNSLLQLLDGDVYDIHVVFSMLFFFWCDETSGKSPFILDKSILLPKLRRTLTIKKEDLKKYFGGEAGWYMDGLWGLVIRTDNLCRTQWGFSIINDFADSDGVMDYVIQGTELIVYGKPVKFKASIWSAERYKDRIIVVLNASIGTMYDTCVLYAVSKDGEILWEVESTNKFLKGNEIPTVKYSFAILKDKLYFCDAFKNKYVIDIMSGKVLKKVPNE